MTQSLVLVGSSPVIELLREEIQYASRTDAKVLITGESGSGKEIVARLIHSNSRRRHGQLVTVNTAAVTETLLETELFGHARGSFTGAYRDHAGVFERANGGSVFLDEVGEMTARMQGLLLRFLETGEIQRVGSEERVQSRADVRVIAATNRDLMESVGNNTFRRDLYYRLNVIHLQVPPLRERAEDVLPLLRHFLELFSRQYQVECPAISSGALALLEEYAWPGNVRELRNIVERLIVRSGTSVIRPESLPNEVVGRPARNASLAQVAQPHERSVSDALFDAMLGPEHQSFWSVVYGPFVGHDLTREHVRNVVSRGLERTAGNYKVLTELFNMPPHDYKRFLTFLRKYHCHVPFQQFRSAAASRLADQAEDDKRIELSA